MTARVDGSPYQHGDPVTDDLVLDLFAGPGGWDTGLRIAGFTGRIVGIEHDWAACKTAMAAGHQRVQADVAAFPLKQLAGRVTGLLGSPPCTTFSGAGHGAGRLVTELLLTAMTHTARGKHVLAQLRRDITHALRGEALRKYPKGTRVQRSAWCRKQATITALVLQPLRYILAIQPQWIALEQVREVAPLWKHLAMLLREMGYNTWQGVVSAERFGVPQTRVRAVLVARLDGPVSAPEPTHQAYRKDLNYDTAGDLFGAPLPPPVSMAEAIGWGMTARPSVTVAAGSGRSGGADPLDGGAGARATLRNAREAGLWKENPTGRHRPTSTEAAILQSFPPGYPWQGDHKQQVMQIGNAVPPLLTAAVLYQFLRSATERAA